LAIEDSSVWLKNAPPVPPLLAKFLLVNEFNILPTPTALHPNSNLTRPHVGARRETWASIRKTFTPLKVDKRL
jgi:hypothetical protein